MFLHMEENEEVMNIILIKHFFPQITSHKRSRK